MPLATKDTFLRKKSNKYLALVVLLLLYFKHKPLNCADTASQLIHIRTRHTFVNLNWLINNKFGAIMMTISRLLRDFTPCASPVCAQLYGPCTPLTVCVCSNNKTIDYMDSLQWFFLCVGTCQSSPEGQLLNQRNCNLRCSTELNTTSTLRIEAARTCFAVNYGEKKI